MKSQQLNYGSRAQASASNSDRLSSFAIFLLIAAISHQAFFCFVNTNIAPISAGFLMLTELVLLGVVFVNFVTRKVPLVPLILLLLVFANTFILSIFQYYFDPKVIRNLMSPILLIWLGTQYNNKISTDTIVKYLALTVVAIGIFEFVLPDLYVKVFNVVRYHIAIGRSTELATEYTDLTFAANGTRWVGRFLLPFLGDHRTSSIFLETVSMGNFAVLVACWGLSKQTIREAGFFIMAACIIAVLADSRFASMLITIMLLVRLCMSLKWLELTSYLMPLFALLVCFYFATPIASDDFKGRLGSTGNFILNFKLSEFFGVSSHHYFMFVDQGYAYLMHFAGLFIALVLWVSFCRIKTITSEATRFKSLIAILISTNLAISGDSIFAFKWVALMWFLLGTQMQTTNGFKVKK